MAKAITPEDVKKKFKDGAHLPEFVIETINELIEKNYKKSRYFSILQKDIVEAIQKKAPLETRDGKQYQVTWSQIFERRWLEFEDFYRAAGWKIEYDKPAYNESYEPIFKFELP